MTDRWTPQDVADYQAKRGANAVFDAVPTTGVSKYNNRKTPAFGIMFASKKEANRYEQLKLMEAGGVVKDIRTQVRYPLEINGIKICDYVADFVYMDKFSRPGRNPWKEVVEDTKGYRTELYKLKKKLMLAIYGIEIRET